MESGVGQTLRAARAKRGATIEEVAASTKIQPRLLRAIEAEDWDALPGEFYASRFVNTYAQYLGLDVGAVVPADAGNREPRVEPRALRRATRGGPRRGGRAGSRRGGTGAARARGGLGPGSRAGGGGISTRAVGAAVILAAIVAGFIVVVTGSGGGGGKGGKGVTTTPAGKQAGAGGRAGANAGAGAGANAGGKKGGGGRSSPARKNAELTLTTKAEVWVCLLNSKGNALIKGLVLPAGEREGPYRSAGFTVAFGNGGVAMEVDGKPVKTAASSDPVGYRIGRGGSVTPLSEGERPTCA